MVEKGVMIIHQLGDGGARFLIWLWLVDAIALHAEMRSRMMKAEKQPSYVSGKKGGPPKPRSSWALQGSILAEIVGR